MDSVQVLKNKTKRRMVRKSIYPTNGCKTKYQKHKTIKSDREYLYGQKKKLKPTGSEIEFSKKLDSLAIKYDQQYVMNKNGFSAIYDFSIKEYGLFVEIDGDVHNGYEQRKKDEIKDKVSIELFGIPVLWFTNSEAINFTPEQIKAALEIASKMYQKITMVMI
jgi:very-short-patch-repair endonuclease